MAKQHAPGFLKVVNQARESVRECNVADVRARLDRGEDFLIIDVREESEFAAGTLPGAIHIGKGVIERDLEKLVPDLSRELVLFCGGGFRSVLAAESIQKMGYQNVISMDGGWSGWKQAGYPIDQPQK